VAIEKDNFGFRVDSWNSKIAAHGQETFEKLTNGEMAELVGCTEGSASNYRKTVSEVTGWAMVAGKRSNGDNGGDKPAVKRTNGKRKGCLPARLDQSVNKALTGIIDSDDPAYIESPTWEQFKQARANQGENWITFISNKLKTDKEKSEFELWITSNDAADVAENAATAAQQKALQDAIALIEKHGGKVIWD
jgi:uncharacterized protein GlcG (DUF336 family)